MLVTYKPGKIHLNADFFSRLRQNKGEPFVIGLLEEEFEGISDEEIISFLEQDPEATMEQVESVQWGAEEEEVFLQTPFTEIKGNMERVTLEEIQRYSMADPQLLLLMLWIQGNEVQKKKIQHCSIDSYRDKADLQLQTMSFTYVIDQPKHQNQYKKKQQGS